MTPRIGISGWTYVPWRGGAFYPKGLPHKQELPFASRHLNSIEINGTFYSLARPSSFIAGRDATPDDFVFGLKGGRFITHLKRLKDCEIPLANFFASGVLELGKKLGHVVTIAAVPTLVSTTATQRAYNLTVIDCTASPHTNDTRSAASNGGTADSGVDEGTMRIYTDLNGNFTSYSWGTSALSVIETASVRPSGHVRQSTRAHGCRGDGTGGAEQPEDDGHERHEYVELGG